YLFKQLSDFKAGKERKNAIMSAIVAPLTPEDMRAVAAHYASQNARPGAAHNKDTIDLGQKIYRAGNPETGVPAGAGCHGPDGAGVPDEFPRLSGQHAKYTAAQLHAFRTGERSNDTN